MAASKVPQLEQGRRRAPVADTSQQPTGWTRRMFLNVLEAFFLRWPLYLIPFVLLLTLGVASVARTSDEYRSIGTISAARDTVLSDLNQAANTPGFTWESPASVTSRSVNELLRTAEFSRRVVDAAGINEADAIDPALLSLVGRMVFAYPDGDNLVRIGATTGSPDLSERLADAAIASYIQWVIDSDVSESTSAVAFFEQKQREVQVAVDAARDELEAYLIENPEPQSGALRPAIQQVQVDRLETQLDHAEAQLITAQDKLDGAQLVQEQATTLVQQQLRIVDEPERPEAPQPKLKEAALTMGLFGALAVAVTVALVIFAAMLDRTIRVPNDVRAKFGIDVLAVVPGPPR